ncbi:hypothetical protein HN51_013727 [Arachis hypogaea]
MTGFNYSFYYVGANFLESAAGEHRVQEHQENEEQGMHNILNDYLLICRRMGAEAEKLHIIDKDCIEKGIVELICKHNIKKLVMGAASDKYHSRFLVVSFIVDLELFIMVNDPKVRNLLLGGQRIIWRFPSSIKASKLPKYEFTPTKGSLTSGKQNSHQIDTPAQPQTQVDMNLSAKLYSALRLLRATILVLRTKEELLELNGMSKAKVSNYGDQILETIENTINEYYKLDKSSNGSADSAKRRRDANGGLDKNLKDDDELTKKIKFVELTVMMSMNNENVGMICSKFVEHL